jgi:hypothetical protein
MVLVLGSVLYLFGGGPFSPGPLTAAAPRGQPLDGFESHADFEAVCGRCHAPWQGIEASRCESCHQDVSEQREAGSGLHGRLHDTGRCQLCHTDHQGLTADITLANLMNFDHDRLTDFSLALHQDDYDGRPLTCEACHADGRLTLAAVECRACHERAEPTFLGEHVRLFSDDCLACHDGLDKMTSFNHQQVFPLEGSHFDLACGECHNGQRFAGTPRECAACHQEPSVHAGLFGTDCARCHTDQGWRPAQLTQHKFPLDHGDEGKIDCNVCHTETYASYTCTNCHAHEAAEVAAQHREEGVEGDITACATCHPTGSEDEAEGRESDAD